MESLRWLNQDELLEIRKTFTEKLQEIYFCDFEVKSKILQKIIPTIADDYVASWTEPGPCLKWYGLFEDVYFQLTSRLENYETADLQLFLPESIEINWRIFKKVKLPTFFIKKITWINGYEVASSSLFYIDEDNLKYEFYRAKDENDAVELKKYLIENKFRRNLIIANSENLDLNWIVETEGKILSRYTSRYSCEQFAIRNSKENDLSYFVKCESIPNNQISVFRKGKIVK